MSSIQTIIKILKFFIGFAFILCILFTLLILIMSGKAGMGMEEKGFFNLLLIIDTFLALLLFVLFQIDKKIGSPKHKKTIARTMVLNFL